MSTQVVTQNTRQRPGGLLVPAHVQLGKPRVVHCKRERHHVYIGRPSKWGNPFAIGRDGGRGEVIERYDNGCSRTPH